jgi:DnaJ-domain-containing protein 1
MIWALLVWGSLLYWLCRRNGVLHRVVSWLQQVYAAQDGMSAASSAAERMTPLEAAEILGVPLHASAHDIHAAYKRLLLRVHPDHGGSTALLTKVRTAKSVLLEHV